MDLLEMEDDGHRDRDNVVLGQSYPCNVTHAAEQERWRLWQLNHDPEEIRKRNKLEADRVKAAKILANKAKKEAAVKKKADDKEALRVRHESMTAEAIKKVAKEEKMLRSIEAASKKAEKKRKLEAQERRAEEIIDGRRETLDSDGDEEDADDALSDDSDDDEP
jgi:hypothetical protein